VTLTEVVVVMVLVGLLVAMIDSSLEPAREESRVATCLANLRTITRAAAGYTMDSGSLVFAFPWGYEVEPGIPQFYSWTTEFIWGGGLPDARQIDWDDSQGWCPAAHDTDVYTFLESERPLNEYLYPGVPWCDPERRGRANPLRRLRPMQLPDMYKCPSDSTAAVPQAGVELDGSELPETPIPTWKWWGTSYPINWYWPHYYPGSFVDTLVTRGSDMLEQKADRGASEWILFMENRLNFAFDSTSPRGYSDEYEPRSLQAWHGQQDVHVAGFADGSARYQYFDTHYVDGPGWTLWPNRPWDDPWAQYQDH